MADEVIRKRAVAEGKRISEMLMSENLKGKRPTRDEWAALLGVAAAAGFEMGVELGREIYSDE
jgi:hypothetical protein